MKLVAIVWLSVCAITVCRPQAIVESGDPSYNADSPYNRLYNTRTVITFKGTIRGLQVAPPLRGMGNAITILVKTKEGKTWHVEIGPEWYVNNQHTKLKVKDNVQVTGSRVTIDGGESILAEQIVKKKSVLALRRPMGRPYWDAVYTEAPQDDGTDHRTLSGTITKVDTFIDGTNGLTERVTIHTDDGDYLVALAPDWYMRRQAAQLALGNLVNVNLFAPTGVPVQPIGSNLTAPPIVFANSLNWGQHWMVLRTSNGAPMWYGVDGG